MYYGVARTEEEVDAAIQLAAENFHEGLGSDKAYLEKVQVTKNVPGFRADLVVVACDKNHGVIGTITIIPRVMMRAQLEIPCAYFTSVCVDPPFRGRNHSTHLMNAAIQLATQGGFALAALIARRAVDDYYTKFSFWGVSCHNVVSVGAKKILKYETSSKRGEWELKPCKNGNIDFYNSVFDFNYRKTFGRSKRDFEIWSYIMNVKKGIFENFFELHKHGNLVGYANIQANNIFEISLVKGIETEGLLSCIFDHSISEELRIEIPVGHHLFDRFCGEGDVIYRQCLFGGHMVRVLDRVCLNKILETGLAPHTELNANETMSAIGAQNLGYLVEDKGLGPPIPFNIPRADQI